VLIGSTQKMGTGTNVQKRLVTLHHLDAPWKPAEVEQRDGRILRQGNENDEVAIYRYVTEGSFDAYMRQALETKARFISHYVVGFIMWRPTSPPPLARATSTWSAT
jgi:SNF2 family DNA or RNA helicase